ncbi:GntR family transcriptional regulator [Kitasatospora sp. NPDC008050]|uniref:GntR family transcriptional regulator n=1 Tax=Kitasatospora sp. NPDC008050 TaxID=3364021 RepID=UPI0036EA2141
MSERNPRGTYLRIADVLRGQISDGSAIEKLPSEAALMDSYGAARTTVKRALGVLAAEGLIRSQPGVGWLVVGRAAKPSVLSQLTSLITREKLNIGDTFPSEKKLCEETGAARGTVRQALAQLEGAGILEAQHGKGRFVRSLPVTHDTSQVS